MPFSLYLIHSQICNVTHKTKQLLSLRSPNFACKFLDTGGVASCDFICSATQYREQNGTTGDILLAVWGLAGLEVLCSTTLDTYNRSGSQAWLGCPYSSSHWIKSKLLFFYIGAPSYSILCKVRSLKCFGSEVKIVRFKVSKGLVQRLKQFSSEVLVIWKVFILVVSNTCWLSLFVVFSISLFVHANSLLYL